MMGANDIVDVSIRNNDVAGIEPASGIQLVISDLPDFVNTVVGERNVSVWVESVCVENVWEESVWVENVWEESVCVESACVESVWEESVWEESVWVESACVESVWEENVWGIKLHVLAVTML